MTVFASGRALCKWNCSSQTLHARNTLIQSALERETVPQNANARRLVTFLVNATPDRPYQWIDPLIVAAAISLTHGLTAPITNTFSCRFFCSFPTTHAQPLKSITTSTSIPSSTCFLLRLQSTSNMSVVSLLGVEVKNNPARFDEPYEFEITFECLEQLQKGECTCH